MSDLAETLNGDLETPEETTETDTIQTASDVETTEPTGEETSPPEESVEVLKAKLEATQGEIDAFKTKAIDETGKRQALEQQYQTLQQQMTASQEKPDFWEDPDKALSTITSEFDRRIQQVNTNTSVQIMRSLHDDYDQMEQVFVEAAQNNTALVAQMGQSDNPAKFAYDYGKTQQQMQELSDPEAYRAKIEAEVRAKIEEENKEKIEAGIRKHTDLPGSLSTERGVGSVTSTTSTPELDQLIG